MRELTNKFSAFVGLDWANNKHDVCVQVDHDAKRTFEIISHTPEALNKWLTKLHHQAKGNIELAVELTKGPIVYALQKYSFITAYPVQALTLARYRQAFE